MAKKGKRRRIEILFAQLYDQFRLKLNHAKKALLDASDDFPQNSQQ
jgi:hypothetical protein